MKLFKLLTPICKKDKISNMMPLVSAQEFKRLSIYKRLMVLRYHGEVLAVRRYMANEIFLYRVGDYFAEAWFRYGTNDLTAIELVHSDYQINQYIDQIDITDLLK